jgi:hypothetical protein
LLLVRLQDDEHDPGMHAETATVLSRRVQGRSGEADGEGLDQVGVRVGTRHDEEGLRESFGEVREAVQRGDDVRRSRLVEDGQCLSLNLPSAPPPDASATTVSPERSYSFPPRGLV